MIIVVKCSIDPWCRIKLSLYFIFGGFALCALLQLICAILPGVQLYLEIASVLLLVMVMILGIPYSLYASRKYQISQGWIEEDDPFAI